MNRNFFADLHRIFDIQKKAYFADPYPAYERRIDRIQRVGIAIRDNKDDLIAAIGRDFENRALITTLGSDILGTLRVIDYTRAHVREWMQNRQLVLEGNLSGMDIEAAVFPEPKGVVGIISPWNAPVLLAVAPAVGALAAGNRVMIKPSEFTPNTSSVLAACLGKYFEESELTVINGNKDIASEFTKLNFDHILYTGSSNVGRLILASAAESLTPVTLEMGGKSPVIISRAADLDVAARRVVFGKMSSSGQVCVAPDYVMLPLGTTQSFVSKALKSFGEFYPNFFSNSDCTSIINERNVIRLCDLISDALALGARLHLSEGGGFDRDLWIATRRIPLVLISGVTGDMRISKEEIFGPILPIVEYRTFNDAIDYIRKGEKPLASYYFGEEEEEISDVINKISAGGLVINDVRIQLRYESLPFGGVGDSGMGRYRGRAGFDTFSNLKTVMRQKTGDGTLAASRPPFGEEIIEGMRRSIETWS